MNPYTGELMMLAQEQPAPDDFELVSKKLQAAARQELAGRERAVVDLSAPTPLAEWANKRRVILNRKKAKSKAKAKIAAASRRKNRKC